MIHEALAVGLADELYAPAGHRWLAVPPATALTSWRVDLHYDHAEDHQTTVVGSLVLDPQCIRTSHIWKVSYYYEDPRLIERIDQYTRDYETLVRHLLTSTGISARNCTTTLADIG